MPPAELSDNLAKLRLHPAELDQEHILPFVPNAADVDQEKDKRLVSLAKIIADCTTIHAAGTALMQLEPWDYMAIYYDAIDHFGHGFMRYHPPRSPWVKEEDFEMYKGVTEAGYRYHDLMLGALLTLAGEDTTIILNSDHGFHPDHLRPQHIPMEPAGPAEEHRHYGIFAMKGPGIKKDERVYGTNLLDLAPTILHLFGLAVGQDFDGKVISTAFEEPQKIETIPSWDDVAGEDGMHPPDKKLDPIEAKEAIDQLVALGYIEEPDENKEKAVEQDVRELKYNLARSYIDAGRYLNAIPIFEELWQKWPEEHRFGIQLYQCQQALELTDKMRVTFDKILENKKEYSEKALQVAVMQSPNHAEAHKRLAYIYKNRLKEFDKAEQHIKLAKLARKNIVQVRKGRGLPEVTTLPQNQDITEFEEELGKASEEAMQKFKEEVVARDLDTKEVITIVSGLPRSGTSMMMQMLAAGGIEPLTDGQREADEDNPRGYYELEKAILENHPKVDALFVSHKLTVENPQECAARVNKFFGGTMDENAMAAVVDPSLHRQKK